MLKIETKFKILHIMDRADFGNASCTCTYKTMSSERFHETWLAD